MNIAQQMVQGSRNIDQMRKDIDQVISMLDGMVGFKDYFCNNPEYELTIHGFTKGYWHIYIVTGEIMIVYKPTSGSILIIIVSESAKNKIQKNGIEAKHVQEVYEALPILVKGLIKKFPKREGVIRPFLNAGKVKM